MANQHPLLIFRLSEQLYGLPIEQVIEAAAMVEINRLPDADPALLGVINRHGEVLPLIDLSRAFGMDGVEISVTTLFIVVEAANLRAGLVVDEVFQVQYLAADSLTTARNAGRYISHLVSDGDNLYQIIDPHSLLLNYLIDMNLSESR